MMPAPLPPDEGARLATLHSFAILDTPPEEGFDRIAKLTASILDVPIALISLVDADRQWFKAHHGLTTTQTPRDVSFCGHVVAQRTPLIVSDARADVRFADNPLVVGEPGVRFYAGVPLRAEDGSVLGTLCGIDHRAREPSARQLEALGVLASHVVSLLELRRAGRRLSALHHSREHESDAARRLLERMLKRNQFDPAHVRCETQLVGTFGGDVVFGRALDDGRYRWLVGDVTGHTLASALVTIPISMVFHAMTQKSLPLDAVVETMDTQLEAQLTADMFFAAAICELDRARGTLAVANAGAPAVVVRRGSGALDLVASARLPLGIAPSPAAIQILPVAPGDRIYVFTDGFLEVRDDGGTMLGLDAVCHTLRAVAPAAAFDALSAVWRNHATIGQPLEDDLSIVEVVV
jgi:serine phosphatase RsbU (regulator of sigma subunit)